MSKDVEMAKEVHEAAAEGYERQSGSYSRGRPTYRPELVQRIADSYRPEAGSRLVELGAGTGIFTAQLAAAGVAVLAVEPVAAMRQTLLDAVGPESAGVVEAVSGTAEEIPCADGSVQTVVASQSFHWFDYPAALAEIARVLVPGGHLVTVWNVRDNRVPWVAAYTEVIDRHASDTPRHYTMAWRRAIDEHAAFSEVEDLSVPNPWPTDRAGALDRVRSTSFIGALGDADQQTVLDQIGDIVAPLGQRFDYPYTSELQAWRRA